MKKIILLFSVLLSVFSVKSQQAKWIPFEWVGEFVSDKYFDKLAIKVPVQINNIEDNLYMQFDLGATNTVIYGKSFSPYLEKNKDLLHNLDTANTFIMQGKNYPKFTDVSLKLGNVTFKSDVGLFKNHGSTIAKDSIGNGRSKLIGTLAPDLFKNKILIIDFPKNRFAVLSSIDELDKTFKKDIKFFTFQKFGDRIKIPVQVNDKIEHVLYDTGASIFPLQISKDQVSRVSNSKIVDTLKVNSWGEKVEFYGVQLMNPLVIGNRSFPNVIAYYEHRNEASDFFKKENLLGLMGNVLFLDKIVIIDYQNDKIGLID